MGQRYIRYEVVPLDEFLNDIGDYWDKDGGKVQRPNGKWVGCTGLRLRTFYRSSREPTGLVCVSCGLEATHFAVESSPGTERTHMNLYGVRNEEEILFTHDHILARALGGADDLSNSQTMCSPCNSRKSRDESREVLRLRSLQEGPPKPPGIPRASKKASGFDPAIMSTADLKTLELLGQAKSTKYLGHFKDGQLVSTLDIAPVILTKSGKKSPIVSVVKGTENPFSVMVGREDGTIEYFLETVDSKRKRHRIDGPAIINPDGKLSWFITGRMIHSAADFQLWSGISDNDLKTLIEKYGDIC